MRRVHTVRLAESIFFLTVLAFVSLAGPAPAQEAKLRPITPRGELSAEEKGTLDLFQRARDSVVYINTSERVLNLWTRNVLSIPRGTGSGFVWDERGHLVTNYHVVAGASEAHVRLMTDAICRRRWSTRAPTMIWRCSGSAGQHRFRQWPSEPAKTCAWANVCSPLAIRSDSTGL